MDGVPSIPLEHLRATGDTAAIEAALRHHVDLQDIADNALRREPVVPSWTLWLAIAFLAPFAAAFLSGWAQ